MNGNVRPYPIFASEGGCLMEASSVSQPCKRRAGVVASPTRPRGPGHTAPLPGATMRVLRTPGEHLGCEKTPVHIGPSAHTSA
jgi:hypothetical protein